MPHTTLRFLHRGRPVECHAVPPDRTLLELLRQDLRLSAAKEGCNEGDCGACTVVLGAIDASGTGLRYQAINACIRLAHSIDGMALWTAADLAAADGTPHPVQQALLQSHASQCGFCTPGFAMSLFALYQNQVLAGQSVTREQAQVALAGNLCRCTGYRPLLEAAQSLAALPRVEQDDADLLLKLKLLGQSSRALDPDFVPDNLTRSATTAAGPANAASGYSAPTRLAELLACRAAWPQAQIVAGATDVGLWLTKQQRQLAQIIDVTRCAELLQVQRTPGWLCIGAAVSLSDAFVAMLQDWPELRGFLQRFAGPPVRNSGTLGGNVVNGSPIGDSMPLLIALGARLLLASQRGQRRLALENFYLGYRQTALAADEVLLHIEIPTPAYRAQPGLGAAPVLPGHLAGTLSSQPASAAAPPSLVLRAWKISKRFEDDISAVCLALRLEIQNQHIVSASIGVGGVAATPMRAIKTEAALAGCACTQATFDAATEVLRSEFTPISDLRASAAYRRSVLGRLLQRLWLELQRSDAGALSLQQLQPLLLPQPAPAEPAEPAPAVAATPAGVAGQSLPHDSAAAQIAGRAPYIDDLPETEGLLHAAPILSTQAHARLNAIDTSAARAMPGVVELILAADVPGQPRFASMAGDEPIFASDTVQYVGQVVGLVLARTVQQARRAARAVRLDVTPLPALLSVADALAAQSYVLPPVTLRRGDAEAALAQAQHRLQGTLQVGGQEHFYLEGQIAVALPQEQNQWLIHSSTQHPGDVQHWVAQALGLANHAVRVECRRMGGAFGGKESQAGHVAVWAAVAAHKLRRPVKLRLDRDDDFMITGKRHPFEYRWEVGFDDSGRITGLDLQMAVDCGFCADLSGPVADRAIFHADNAYFLQDLRIVSYRCKTHTQSHTAFRGFGGPQGMIVIETILGDIARALRLDALAVRLRNLYSDESLPHAAGQSGESAGTEPAPAPPGLPQRRDTTHYGMRVADNILLPLLSKLEQSAQYRQRQQAVSAWNQGNRIIKRGLALTPVKFGISFTATLFNQAGALVHVYTDGSVLVNHGGTEMGQGLNTKVAQIVADELGLPLARVRCSAADTDKIPNASATAASAGTDLNGRAAQLAARQVRQRLAALVGELDGCAAEAVGFVDGQVASPGSRRSFEALVKIAYARRIQLWSDGFYRTPVIHYDKTTLSGQPFYYFAYGAACSEVALDCLTGESRLLRVDILHDVGRSINPALDRGQIEGGFVQGLGWLTTEQLVWDAAGRLATHAPSSYKIPTAGDLPAHFAVALWDEPNRADNVLGSKAVGEPPLMLAISVYEALRQALAAASGSAQVVLRAPATPEHLLAALGGILGE